MPGGNVLVGQAGGDVKHDDRTLPVDTAHTDDKWSISSWPEAGQKLPG